MSTGLWIVIVILGVLVGILIGWLVWGRKAQACAKQVRNLERQLREREGQAAALKKRLEAAEKKAKEAAAAAVPQDLTVIEGIGPKIAQLLNEAGIRNYGQLAAASVDKLSEIVRSARLAMADPSTWPQQAKLAAADKWSELEALQDELKGGRKA